MCMRRTPCVEEIVNEIEAEQAEDVEYISEEARIWAGLALVLALLHVLGAPRVELLPRLYRP